jgi:NAD(P)-dependent dehydrogenase (short-subunit alcohol dehydrogenase family)
MAKDYVDQPCFAYKISKAALNMMNVQYAQQYAKEGFTFLAVSPGVSKWKPCGFLTRCANLSSGYVPISVDLLQISP